MPVRTYTSFLDRLALSPPFPPHFQSVLTVNSKLFEFTRIIIFHRNLKYLSTRFTFSPVWTVWATFFHIFFTLLHRRLLYMCVCIYSKVHKIIKDYLATIVTC